MLLGSCILQTQLRTPSSQHDQVKCLQPSYGSWPKIVFFAVLRSPYHKMIIPSQPLNSDLSNHQLAFRGEGLFNLYIMVALDPLECHGVPLLFFFLFFLKKIKPRLKPHLVPAWLDDSSLPITTHLVFVHFKLIPEPLNLMVSILFQLLNFSMKAFL